MYAGNHPGFENGNPSKNEMGTRTCPVPTVLRTKGLGTTLAGGIRQMGGNRAEDRAEAACHVRHDSTGGNRHEASHQGVFNQVLTTGIFPDS